MENINNEILNQLNQIRIEINFIKQAIDDGELTKWAENELEKARATPEKEFIDIKEIAGRTKLEKHYDSKGHSHEIIFLILEKQ